ncbi:hypothetical protein Q005_02114 [Pseudomonas aeruginosa X24509]|nr:hypothetical protein Q005_02114 [Pseudomonas aeruginosa X24509]
MQETDETLDELPPLEARCEIREVSRGTACVALLAGLVAGATGLWLASLPNAWRLASGQWLFWLPAALLLGGGLYACLAGVFLYRRHGQVALTLTPESIAFANAPQVPMYTFQSLEIERGRWLELTFATTFDCTAPSFDNHARFDPRAFARPEARAVAGGKRVKLALCGAALNGQKMELEPLARLIYRYILAGHRQRALQHHRAPGSDGSGARSEQRSGCALALPVHRGFQARHHLAHEERVVRHAELRADPLRPAGPLALASPQQALDFVAHGALQAFAGTIAGQVEAQAGLFLALQGAASGQRQFGKVVAHDRCSLSRRQAISDYCTFIQ